MSKYLTVSLIGIALLVQSMGGNAVAVAFPEITSSFDVSLVLAGWVLSAYTLTEIVTIPISGKSGDALGRKRTFMFFVALFTAGSLLCAVAGNIYQLILFRVIQGAGAGGFITSATGIVADTFPEARQRWIGLITSIGTAGTVAGINLGGWLTQEYGWRYIFWFSVPAGLATLAAGVVLLKKDSQKPLADIDTKGAGLFTVSLIAVMVGISTIGQGKALTAWPMVIGLLVLGVAVFFVFYRHEMRANSPLLDPETIRGRPFVGANVYNFNFGLLGGVFSFIPLYAVTTYGVSTVASGLILTPRTIAVFVTSIVGSFFLVRWGYRKPMLIGSVLMVLACAILALESTGTSVAGLAVSGAAVMITGVVFTGLGHGIASPASNNACVELMPDRISTITGVRSTFRKAGQSVGIAVAALVLDLSGNLLLGFRYVFIGAALITLITLPSIFAMPRSPCDVPRDIRA